MGQLTDRAIYDAFAARDATPSALLGVRTTGVFCRPGCPARLPRFENCEFFRSPEAALKAGYRACKRCHPTGEDFQLVRDIIALVEEWGRVGEEELRGAGIDPDTARRRFQQKLGMSVAEYSRLRALGRAAQTRAQGGSVTDAQLDAGFASPSGFRAAYARTFGTAPREAAADPLFIDWIDTRFGPMVSVSDSRALYLVEFTDRVRLPRQFQRLRRMHGRAVVPGETTVSQSMARQMDEYGSGTRRTFDVALETAGTPFQGGVWAALQTIPYGETWSYAELARAVGNDKAVRAVASANGANGLAIVIPCHRVIASDGGLGGYAGGVERKRQLLELEAAHR